MTTMIASSSTDPIDQHRRFLSSISTRRARRRRLLDGPSTSSTSGTGTSTFTVPPRKPITEDSARTKPGRKLNNVVPGEETVRNDLSVRYIVSGEWSGNRITGVSMEDECREYPKLRRLQDLKRTLSSNHAHPPLYIPLDPITESPRLLTTLLQPHVFDVVLIRPPTTYSWAEITAIPIRLISGDPSFVFLWVGSSDGDGLERGREALLKWGFRRCEEIVWVKRNTKRVGKRGRAEVGSGGNEDVGQQDEEEDGMPVNVLVNQKEHCLVGIRGTVRRKTDNWFVHCNVDTDVIVWEPDPTDSNEPEYPPQLHTMIENFCLGARRLDLFASRSQARRGWVTVGPDEVGGGEQGGAAEGGEVGDEVQAFDSARYGNYQEANKDEMGRYVLPLTQEIDHLRPKSPVRGERGGEPFHLPHRPGHTDGPANARGRQGGHQVPLPHQYHQAQQPLPRQQPQGMLSPVPMSVPGGLSNFNHMASSPAVNGMSSNPTAQPPMGMMNAMNMMGMNNMGMGMGMNGMNGMPMMGMGMGMGFPMMNMNMNMGMGGMMPFGNMNVGMGGMGMGMMNPLMQGMFGGQAGSGGNNGAGGGATQGGALPQGHVSPKGNQQPGA